MPRRRRGTGNASRTRHACPGAPSRQDRPRPGSFLEHVRELLEHEEVRQERILEARGMAKRERREPAAHGAWREIVVEDHAAAAESALAEAVVAVARRAAHEVIHGVD